jgi:hypothetical protein
MDVLTDMGPVQAVRFIDRKIEGLDDRIHELRQVGERLFSPERNGSKLHLHETAPKLPPKAKQLCDWVRAHGPITRKEIRDKSGVSAGTIANYLTPNTVCSCFSWFAGCYGSIRLCKAGSRKTGLIRGPLVKTLFAVNAA